MSGHSKWSTIKRQKGAADARRGAVFTKLGNTIAIAVRQGGGITDPEANFRLRLAVDKARAANMPKENIQRAIDRGAGKGEGAELVEAVFEGFGPGGAAVVMETVTDNSTRTAAGLRSLLEKHGGNLSSPGAVAYLFTRAGEIEINKNNKNNKNSNPINPINPINTVTFEEVFERAVEAGAEDVEDSGESFSVYTKPADLHAVQERLMATGLAIVNSGLVFRPNKETLIALSPEDAGRMEALLEALDEMDEVQEVYTNTQ